MTQAFGYICVSGNAQIEGDGFECQTQAIKEYAAANGIKVVRIFQKEGVSGTVENMDRPAWGELMATLYNNDVRSVLIEKLDRLARDLMVQEAAIADLKRNGFDLIPAYELDLMATDPTRILMRHMLGAFAQYDKSRIVAKLRGARMRKKAQTGSCEGRKRFGYYDGEQTVIERMTRTAAKRWHSFAVNEILTG